MAPISETMWRRAWNDAKHGWADWRFLLLEGVGAPVAGILTNNAWVTVIVVIVGLLSILIGATARAPLKQRNEAREQVIELPKIQADNEKLHFDNAIQQKELDSLKAQLTPVLAIDFRLNEQPYFQVAHGIPTGIFEMHEEQRYRVRVANDKGQDLENLSVELVDIKPEPEGFFGNPAPLGFMHKDRSVQSVTINAHGEVFVDVVAYWPNVAHLSGYILVQRSIDVPNMISAANKYTFTIRATASNVLSCQERFYVWVEDNHLKMGRIIEASAQLGS